MTMRAELCSTRASLDANAVRPAPSAANRMQSNKQLMRTAWSKDTLRSELYAMLSYVREATPWVAQHGRSGLATYTPSGRIEPARNCNLTTPPPPFGPVEGSRAHIPHFRGPPSSYTFACDATPIVEGL